MKPVFQTKFGSPDGNCFAACIATIFELELEAVPHFMYEDDWYASFEKWSQSILNYHPVIIKADNKYIKTVKPPNIVSGPAPRGLHHATVWYNGEMYHDPHPSGEGLISITDSIVFIPLNLHFYCKRSI